MLKMSVNKWINNWLEGIMKSRIWRKQWRKRISSSHDMTWKRYDYFALNAFDSGRKCNIPYYHHGTIIKSLRWLNQCWQFITGPMSMSYSLSLSLPSPILSCRHILRPSLSCFRINWGKFWSKYRFEWSRSCEN